MCNYSAASLIYIVYTSFLFFVERGSCRAFGQRVEYRYEFDPKRDVQPRVQVKYDDVTDETELMRIFNHRKPIDVRKSPSRYEYPPLSQSSSQLFRDENENDSIFINSFEDMDRGNRQMGWRNIPMAETQMWHRGFESLPVQKLAENRNSNNNNDYISEHMAAFLRRQSETILSSHFPSVSQSRFSDPPHFKFLSPPSFIPKFYF